MFLKINIKNIKPIGHGKCRAYGEVFSKGNHKGDFFRDNHKGDESGLGRFGLLVPAKKKKKDFDYGFSAR